MNLEGHNVPKLSTLSGIIEFQRPNPNNPSAPDICVSGAISRLGSIGIKPIDDPCSGDVSTPNISKAFLPLTAVPKADFEISTQKSLKSCLRSNL